MTDPNEQRPLTSRQQTIYDFIEDKIVNRGYGPTVREIGNEVGIRSPNGVMCHLKALEKKGFIKREPNLSRAIQLTAEPQKRMSLQLAGQIAAGNPLEAVEQDEKVDFSQLFENDGQYCLRVEGNSLNGAQIAADDHVVLREQKKFDNGSLALVSVDGAQPMFKRISKQAKRVKLEAVAGKAKPTYSNSVDILGVVVGVIRKY